MPASPSRTPVRDATVSSCRRVSARAFTCSVTVRYEPVPPSDPNVRTSAPQCEYSVRVAYAAVAAGMCYGTIDTDAIGSCRLPAACCGVVGFKGTYGLISARGILEGEKADPPILLLSHPAITTRTVNDTATLVKILADRDTKTIRQPRIGVVTNIKPTQSVRATFKDYVAHYGIQEE